MRDALLLALSAAYIALSYYLAATQIAVPWHEALLGLIGGFLVLWGTWPHFKMVSVEVARWALRRVQT